MTDQSRTPHYPAAFINAIAEEGTKAKAVEWLQKIWNERCTLELEAADLRERLASAEHSAKHWEAEARRYAGNSDYWHERLAKAQEVLGAIIKDSTMTGAVATTIVTDNQNIVKARALSAPQPDGVVVPRETLKVYKSAPNYRDYLTARFKDRLDVSFEWNGKRYRYLHTDFDDTGDFDVLLAAAKEPRK